MRVPYVDLAAQHAALKDELLAAMAAVLEHGQFILGDEVSRFENRFADVCGARFAIGVGSGTDALILALRALGVGPGDEVITAPNSFVASAGSIAAVGARPVFVDVREDCNLDPSELERAVTRRTRAIMPVHLSGRPADMDAINAVAKRHHLYVVEDCAQAVAAEYRGRRAGTLGTVGCFSLHPLKTLNACGDAGVITVDDEQLCERLREMRNHGLRGRDECIRFSGNSRLDSMQAAILLVKLKHLERWTSARRANADAYRRALAGVSEIQVPEERSYEKAVYHTFVIQADQRDALKSYLAECGVETAIHYPIPIHLQPAAAELGYARGSFPVTERLAGRILSLPVYPELGHERLEFTARTIAEFYRAREVRSSQ